MEKDNLIRRILNSESLLDSKELLKWIEESADNRREYIRIKNIWALLQKGKEMRAGEVIDGYKDIQSRIKTNRRTFNIQIIIKYAAIIILALLGGYYINSLRFNEKVAFYEIKVPNGNRTSIVLPDGSEVWLTNNSKLIYPESFKGDTRRVKLEGEAFFNVVHNEEMPLLVDLGKQRIKVLGTEFSVISYPDDNEVQVDLVSGKIQFEIENEPGNYKSYFLRPSHSLLFNKRSGELIETRISNSFFSYWKFGIYEFKNESFENLAKKIERIYGVEIIFEDLQLKKRLFTGTFNIDDNIYTMMEVFKQASGKPFRYTIDRDRIYIKSYK